jgi:hypothetical protein
VGAAVPVAPGVVVKDASGFGVAGVGVTFTPDVLIIICVTFPCPPNPTSGTVKATSTSPQAGSATITTDANGVARLFSWTLGRRGANTMPATLQTNLSISVTFGATGTAGPPTSIAFVDETPSSNNQTTIANTATPVAPGVVLKDANGLTVDAGHNVTFAIQGGGGMISASGCTGSAGTATVATDANGVARLGCWKPGSLGSSNLLRAEVAATPSLFVNFLCTGTTGPPTQIAFVNNPWETVRTSSAVGGTPTVRVADAGNNALSGQTVVWSNAGNVNSSVTGTTSGLTGGQGLAVFPGTWTAGATVNVGILLKATVQGTSPEVATTFQATTNGPVNTSLSSATNPSPTTVVNTNVATLPVLTLRDGQNRPIAGHPVVWSITANPNTAALFSSPVMTDSIGRVNPGQWRVSQAAGTNTVRVDVTGTGVFYLFSTSAIAGPATQIAVSGGNNQTAPAFVAVLTPPSVVVRDQFNNPVLNENITFQPSANGSVTGGTAFTNASGIATVGSWTMGVVPGTQQLNAFLTSSPTINTVFSATATLDGCATSTPYTIGTVVNGSLANTDCQVTGYNTDMYSFTLTSQAHLTFSHNPFGAYEPVSGFYLWRNVQFSWRSGNAADSNWVTMIAAPGTYIFRVSPWPTSLPGGYRITSTLNPPIFGCGYPMVTKGITVTHTLDAQCNYSPVSQFGTAASKVYHFWLQANESATVRMNAGSLSNPYLECYSDLGASTTLIAGCFNDNETGGTNNARLVIPSSPSGRFIYIRASHFTTGTAQTGTYTFSIDP